MGLRGDYTSARGPMLPKPGESHRSDHKEVSGAVAVLLGLLALGSFWWFPTLAVLLGLLAVVTGLAGHPASAVIRRRPWRNGLPFSESAWGLPRSWPRSSSSSLRLNSSSGGGSTA
jgi:hypothetical protein